MTNTIHNVPRELKKCAACRAEKPVNEMKTCMHHQMHRYVCDSKCMHDFYNPPKVEATPSPAGVDGLEPSGYDDLWSWFGMSRSSWLTLPRSLMHAMPDDWQKQMAGLLDQWDAAWNTEHLPAPYVSARDGAKFKRWPEWLLNYRHPAKAEIDAVRALSAGKEGE